MTVRILFLGEGTSDSPIAAHIRETLAIASGLNGRRLERFRQRFPQHRRQLLERIDAAGRISDVASWRAFNTDLVAALKGLSK